MREYSRRVLQGEREACHGEKVRGIDAAGDNQPIERKRALGRGDAAEAARAHVDSGDLARKERLSARSNRVPNKSLRDEHRIQMAVD